MRKSAEKHRSDGEQRIAGDPELICGVKREIVESFLKLIRDYYRKADRASYFMEEQGHIMNTSAVANLRDVLSHLATLLDPATPPEHHQSQLENSEEHLRRAILEPYLVVIGRERRELRRLLEQYEKEILPAKMNYPSLADAPEISLIRSREREVATLVAEGRAAKAMNLWNSHWEEGIGALLKAHPLLIKLTNDVRHYLNEYRYLVTTDEFHAELDGLRRQMADQSKALTDRRPKGSPDSSALMQVLSLAEFKLRKAMRERPDNERVVQDAFDTLLHGSGLRHSRERVQIQYGSKNYVPDFTIAELDLAIDLKLCGRDGREKEIIAELNDDILGYKSQFGNILFVVYDLGLIRDVELFTSAFEAHANVLVRVVKH